MSAILGIIPVRERDVRRDDRWVTLGRRPLLDHTVDSARKATRLDRVVVSTESPEIAGHARELGVEAPFLRPQELAVPTASLTGVVRHCLDWLENRERYRAQIVVLLEPSHPIRPEGLIDRVIESLVESDLDTVFTVFESRHVFWRLTEEGVLSRVEFEEGSTRSTRQPLYGQLKGLACATRSEMVRTDTLVGRRVGIVPVRGLAGLVDLQEEGGLELAEFLLSR